MRTFDYISREADDLAELVAVANPVGQGRRVRPRLLAQQQHGVVEARPLGDGDDHVVAAPAEPKGRAFGCLALAAPAPRRHAHRSWSWQQMDACRNAKEKIV